MSSSVKQLIEKYETKSVKDSSSHDSEWSYEAIKAKIIVGNTKLWLHSRNHIKLNESFQRFLQDSADSANQDFCFSMALQHQLENGLYWNRLGKKYILFCEYEPTEECAKKFNLLVCKV